MSNEILVVPFFGQGHLYPCSELCKHLTNRNYQITLIIPSFLSSSISPSLRNHPLIKIYELPSPSSAESGGPIHHHQNMAQPLADLLSCRSKQLGSSIPICAIVDVMMSWSNETIRSFKIPIISFFTSGACSAAMEYATWKLQALPEKPTPGLIIPLPGLPEDMSLTFSDLTHRDPPPPPHDNGPPPPHHHGGGGGGGGRGRGAPGGGRGGGGGGGFLPPPGPPPTPGHRPPWVSETEDSLALLINTCDDLERPFIEYVANQMGKPVWGVGPLLPEQYWRSADSTLHDHEIRTERKSNVTEDEVSEWLDLKPRGSVIYVSFGSEVSPENEQLAELADALEESNRPFIWVVQSSHGPPGHPPGPPGLPDGGSGGGGGGGGGFFPDGLAGRVGRRGLIIKGWAPQLLILSHPSTAGFLSHCGWNSTVEAIGRGVPILAWPIRGDQHHNAKLVTCHLKVGLMIQDGDRSKAVRKNDIVCGITNLMADDETRKRAASLRTAFDHGFPSSSLASLDAFRDFLNQNCEQK
ncbi:LOW QUALITY PROTEIN: abscisate beta-glucosyltransferase-like [Macadamia integrifolia]|uniref:LOW QUALITY PROTEIN: abscisate beta-glucosyltransferase-like n=1 Tax=Macadamia integrifolia TaxID=60698 RepID=UPI001C4EB3DA|nr:LOW QUALITY PROTEIN: abscisate beta-glucosyltransferase-like [Macadamia integrifolia]